jgi:hypothetical protein
MTEGWSVAEAKHTPGPWRVGACDMTRIHPNWRDEHGNAAPDNFHRNGFAKTIATTGKLSWRSIDQQVADARLIAAAPDMLAALEAIFAVRPENWNDGDDLDQWAAWVKVETVLDHIRGQL